MYRGLTEHDYNIYGRIPVNAVERYEIMQEKTLSNEDFIKLYDNARKFYEYKLKDSEKFNELPIGDRREAIGIWLHEGKLPDWASEENIVKKVCTELGITQKELAEELGMKPTALSNWANGDIPQIAQKALELLLENKKLKENFKILKKAHKILSE